MDTLLTLVKTYPWLTTLVSFWAGTALGTGAVWSLLQYRLARRAHAINAAKALSDLQRELIDKLVRLHELSARYADIRDGVIAMSIPEKGNELLRLQAQIDLLKADIPSAEGRLANLEGREPRSINVQWIRPSPPTGLRFVKEP